MNQPKFLFSSLLLILASLSGPSLLVAQGGTEFPPGHGVTADAVDAYLEVSSTVAFPGDELTLTLTLDFKETTKASATFLSGHYLTFYIGEKQLPSLAKTLPNLLEYQKGTRLIRNIPIDLGEVMKAGDASDGVQRLTISWPGVAGAEVVVQIVPDQRELDVAKLDLAKTKVRLVTSEGDLVLELYPDVAPKHVASFVDLSRKAFYNGTRFHRIIRGQIIQGGCPNTKRGATGRPGTGQPGYMLPLEASDKKHKRGVLSMARGRDRNSAGSQFFLMHGDVPLLDGQYTIFGSVSQGLDVLDKIAGVRVKPNPYDQREASWPVEDVHLYAAVVIPVFK